MIHSLDETHGSAGTAGKPIYVNLLSRGGGPGLSTDDWQHPFSGGNGRIPASFRPTGNSEDALVELGQENLEETFISLDKTWKAQTSHFPTTLKRFNHPAYKQILALGPSTIPFILQSMRKDPDWWFEALETLSGENPACNAKNFYEAVDNWISWGFDNEHLE